MLQFISKVSGLQVLSTSAKVVELGALDGRVHSEMSQVDAWAKYYS